MTREIPLCLLFFLIVAVCQRAAGAAAKTVDEVFETLSSSIVVVKTSDAQGKALGLGSGVTLADGLVVTNCHVMKDAAKVQVVYQKTAYPATRRQTDWDRDVCTLAVPGLNARAATLGATNRLKVGQQVYAVGAPEGRELTMFAGLVSGLCPADSGQYLQISTPISPGASGGGLFDDQGRLIGLPTFYQAEGQPLNFAVPVEWITELPKRLDTAAKPGNTTTIDWLSKALVLEKKKEWPGLLAHAQRWTKAAPKDAGAWYMLGEAYACLNQPVKAMEADQQALHLNPKHAGAWNNLGNAYDDANQPDKALEAYQQALRINHEYAEAWNNLGNAYTYSNQPDRAIDAYQQALRLNPEDAGAWNNLGNAYDDANQPAKALEAYHQALRLNPEDAGAWNNLGTAYVYAKQLAKAIKAYQQALRLNPEYDGAWYNLGNAYAYANQNAKVIKAYQQVLRLNPENAEAWNNLGISYKISGQDDKAIEAYKRLKTLDPVKADKYFNKVILP